jgi:hypothetical protein
VGCIDIQPPSMLSSPSITASAMGSRRQRQRNRAPGQGGRRLATGLLAPSSQYQMSAYRGVHPCSTARLDSWIWLTSHWRSTGCCAGQLPGFRGSTSPANAGRQQRGPEDNQHGCGGKANEVFEQLNGSQPLSPSKTCPTC